MMLYFCFLFFFFRKKTTLWTAAVVRECVSLYASIDGTGRVRDGPARARVRPLDLSRVPMMFPNGPGAGLDFLSPSEWIELKKSCIVVVVESPSGAGFALQTVRRPFLRYYPVSASLDSLLATRSLYSLSRGTILYTVYDPSTSSSFIHRYPSSRHLQIPSTLSFSSLYLLLTPTPTPHSHDSIEFDSILHLFDSSNFTFLSTRRPLSHLNSPRTRLANPTRARRLKTKPGAHHQHQQAHLARPPTLLLPRPREAYRSSRHRRTGRSRSRGDALASTRGPAARKDDLVPGT
jgi:hypothetical protein